MAILWLFSCKNQTLLVRWDALLVLDFSFDLLSGVTGVNLKGDGLALQCLHKDLYLCACGGRGRGGGSSVALLITSPVNSISNSKRTAVEKCSKFAATRKLKGVVNLDAGADPGFVGLTRILVLTL